MPRTGDGLHIVGRQRERQALERLLDADAPERVLLLHGARGMGKTVLLEMLQDRCRQADPPLEVLWVGTESPARELTRLGAGPPPAVVAVDDYERLDRRTHDELIDALPRFVAAGGIVAVAGRVRPDLADVLNPEVVIDVDVTPLDRSEVDELLSVHGVATDSQLLGGIAPIGVATSQAITFVDMLKGNQSQERRETLVLDAVGRERDVYRIEASLRRDRGTLLAVVGDVGTGKSRLLRVVERRARGAGWASARCDDAGELQVMPSTSPDAFVARTLAMLGADAVPADGFVAALAARAPVLVLVDGFRPHPDVAHWFLTDVRSGLAGLAAPVAVVVAGTRDELDDGLLAAADDVVELGPLDGLAVARHLRETAAGIDPPLGDEEIAAYVAAVCPQPDLLKSLTRALRLISPSGTLPEPLAEPDAAR